jgi:hypothetical protein
MFGLERKEVGRRRAKLQMTLDGILSNDLVGRVLDFDREAARAAAVIRAAGYRSGRVIEFGDSLIAGVALSSGATLATRNKRHFAGRGLALINPWGD